MIKDTKTNQKVAYLEGIRGVASVLVVFCHMIATFFVDYTSTISNALGKYPNEVKKIILYFLSSFVDGNLSVHVFWILSAYVITIKLFKSEKLAEDTLIQYTAKRYFRLLIPCFCSVIFAYLLLANNLIYNLDLANKLGKGYSDGWLALSYNFKPNLFLAIKSALLDTFFDYNPMTTYNNVLWSISIELYGSFLLFGLFGITGKTDKRHLLYVGLLIILIFAHKGWLLCFFLGFILSDYKFSGSKANYYNLIHKLSSFLDKFSLISILLLLMFWVFGKILLSRFYVHYEIHNALISFIVLFLISETEALRNFFSLPFFVWLGRVSFGIYLLHIPILFSISSWLFMKLDNLPYWSAAVICCAVTFFFSLILAYYFTVTIDSFSIRFSNKIGNYFKNSDVTL